MLEDLKNNFDFYLRSKTKFSRKNFVEKDSKMLERNLKENLYTKDVLSKFFCQTHRNVTRILDIGCKNWFYAKGEYDFFKSFSDEIFLDGVELDAHRLYSNFYSRYEVAKFYTKDLKNTNYIAGNLLDIRSKYDYIVWFLPFVVKEPHIYWGLPKKYFYPEKLLKHAYDLLSENGEMLIVNQGELEAEAQQEMLNTLGISYQNLGEITSDYYQYNYKRFGFLVKKIKA